MNKVTIDNVTVEGEFPKKVLRHAALKAKLYADTAPPADAGDEGAGIPPPPPPPTLEQVRTWALKRIQCEAGQRLKQLFEPANHLWIPVFEVLHYLDNPDPQPEAYPAIFGDEAKQRGETPADVIKRWLAEYHMLCRQHDYIRTLLYAYTQLIEQAATVDHILQHLAELDWDMPAIDADLLLTSPVLRGRGKGPHPQPLSRPTGEGEGERG